MNIFAKNSMMLIQLSMIGDKRASDNIKPDCAKKLSARKDRHEKSSDTS
jgi:hypothetical protein